MTKEVLIHQIIDVLARAGFALSDRCNIRPRSFDVAARKGETLLLCKVLFNIDGLNEETAREMKYLAEYLGGSAIVLGAKTRDQMLEDSVVYMRYDILALSVQTLHDYFIENIPPLVSAAPGGLYVSIEGDLLKKSQDGSVNVSWDSCYHGRGFKEDYQQVRGRRNGRVHRCRAPVRGYLWS